MTTSAADESADESVRHAAQPVRDRRRRVSRFLQILLGITFAMHVPVGLGVAEIARRFAVPSPWAVGVAWALLGSALFVGRARAAMPDRRRHEALVRFVDIPYFIHWCAALWAFIPSMAATVVVPIADIVRGSHVHLPMAWYAGWYLSGLVVCGYGVLIRRRWFRVVEREVRIADLDARLDGLRIAQLSDLHVGTMTPRAWGLSWSRAANRRAPDLAVVTGDLLTSGTEYHADVAAVVGELRAKLGVFVSMGNHDYFGEGELLLSSLASHGAKVLRNEGVVVEHGGAKFWLAAIDDTWTRRDDMARALRDRPPGMPAILLAHDPTRFDEAAAAGVVLVLSGHTHGGQVAMPFFSRALGLANLAHRYRVGFYRRGRSVLYVHPGLGTTGPPMRLGVAPEVTILVLRAV